MKLPFSCLLRLCLSIVSTGVVMSCATLLQQPLQAQSVPVNEKVPSTDLYQLPATKEKIGVIVNQFRDVLNQSAPLQASTLPTAAPDYTAYLTNTLAESGWFIPVRKQGSSNPLYEGKTVPPGTQQLKEVDHATLAPAASLFMESGVLAYDVNTVTGQAGQRYFGENSSSKYSQGHVTVYLRILSTRSGQILKTIYSDETILSQPVRENTYRYVFLRQFGDPDTTLTTSIEPRQLVVFQAIRTAIQGLIIEGIRDGQWQVNNPSAIALRALLDTYERTKVIQNEPVLSKPNAGRKLVSVHPQITPSAISLQPYVALMRYHGDYTGQETKAAYGLSLDLFLTPVIGVQINAATGTLASQNIFSHHLTSLEGNLIIRPLPYQRINPLLYGGVGVVSQTGTTPFQFEGTQYAQYQAGVGVQYSPNSTFGLRTCLSYNQPLTDALDGLLAGTHKDYYTRVNLGLLFHLSGFQAKSNSAPLR